MRADGCMGAHEASHAARQPLVRRRDAQRPIGPRTRRRSIEPSPPPPRGARDDARMLVLLPPAAQRSLVASAWAPARLLRPFAVAAHAVVASASVRASAHVIHRARRRRRPRGGARYDARARSPWVLALYECSGTAVKALMRLPLLSAGPWPPAIALEGAPAARRTAIGSTALGGVAPSRRRAGSSGHR